MVSNYQTEKKIKSDNKFVVHRDELALNSDVPLNKNRLKNHSVTKRQLATNNTICIIHYY